MKLALIADIHGNTIALDEVSITNSVRKPLKG